MFKIGLLQLDHCTNSQKLQMLRTVSLGMFSKDVRRDDIWQAYFRIIGCAKQFLILENQYLQDPAMADAIVTKAEAEPDLIVLIVVAFEIDDPKNPVTQNGVALQKEFFTRLKAGIIPKERLAVYTMKNRLVHSKLIMADDKVLSMGSLNADPRDFFMDTQLNVVLDDAAAVKTFRHKLWSHDLGIDETIVAGWRPNDFIAKWDAVAKSNEGFVTSPAKMAGEGVIRFDPTTVTGAKIPIPDVLSEAAGERAETDQRSESEQDNELPGPMLQIEQFQVPPVLPSTPVTADPFPAVPYSLTLGSNPDLNSISALARDPKFKDLCVAVIDLSGDPSYIGFNDDDMLYVGSLQKISPMYAAFELRSRVQQHVAAAVAAGLSTTSSTGWQQTLFDDLKTAWKPKLDAAFPARLPKGFPDLNTIFTISTAGIVHFASSGQTLAQLDHIGGSSVAHSDLGFLEHLKLMIRWSNNHAAARCILALSYPYINAALRGAGLFDPGPPPRGLWISGNYDDISKDWLRDFTADDANAGQQKTTRWTRWHSRPKTNFAATARQVARLLAMVELGTLVDAQASLEMRALMSGAELNDQHHPERAMSYVDIALRHGGREIDRVFSKIGIGDDPFIHDCAIVERTVTDSSGDINFRYVVVGLGAPNDLGTPALTGPLFKLFVEIDKVIKIR
jgi:hypothetical protein